MLIYYPTNTKKIKEYGVVVYAMKTWMLLLNQHIFYSENLFNIYTLTNSVSGSKIYIELYWLIDLHFFEIRDKVENTNNFADSKFFRVFSYRFEYELEI